MSQETNARLWYPVFIASGRMDDPISWGPPCKSPAEAFRWLKAEVASGRASMGVVIVFAGGRKEALENYIVPRSVRMAIMHYFDILDSLDLG